MFVVAVYHTDFGMSMQEHPFWHYILVVLVTLIKGVISEVLWFLVGLGGYFIFVSKKSPYDMVLGIPLMLVGLGFVINSLWSEMLSVFSPMYNKGVCFLCNRDEKSERKGKDGKMMHLEGSSEEVKY